MQSLPVPLHALRRAIAGLLCASALLFAHTQAQAQSEVSAALSVLPVASVVGAASVAGAAAGAVVAVPAALLTSGAVLTVKAVQASVRGTVIVLERASDGAAASITLGTTAAGSAALAVGDSVLITVIGSGIILSAAGEAMAFIPNAIGRALLYNEKIL